MSNPAPAGPLLSLPGLDCSHVALLRNLSDRLEAIGSPAAAMALDELAASTEAHLKTVEMIIALVEAMENSAPIH